MANTDRESRRDGRPEALYALLGADGESAREAAWATFIERYSRLLLHTAHRQASSYDTAMNGYAYILQKLREDDFKRLERFDADGSARFSTWLVVVARRLCVDYLRSKYGRERSTDGNGHGGNGTLGVRRRLADLLSEKLELERLPDPSARNPETELGARELESALQSAVQSLPPRDRLLLKLRFHDELTAREIADLMEFPTLFHVYRRLNKVLARLREDLEGRGIEGVAP